MITSIANIGQIAAAGVGAGAALTIARLALGNDLDAVESQAVGIVAAGAALTGYAAAQGGVAGQLVTAYWTIAAIAGVPPVLAYWICRKAEQERARTLRAASIAGRSIDDDRTAGAGYR